MAAPRLAISIGDISGVGPELILKTFADKRLLQHCTPIVFGHRSVLNFYSKNLKKEVRMESIKSADQAHDRKLNVVDCWKDEVRIDPGNPYSGSGKFAFQALEEATKALGDGTVEGLVTAPINKRVIQEDGFGFPGHTEYLADKFGSEDSLMFMVSESLRVGMVVGHVPMKDLVASVKQDLIVHKLELMHYSLLKDFGVVKPRIAVLGLNPHAGEEGKIGTEEQEVIIPAIEQAKGEDILAFGPYPADTFFTGNNYASFDAVLAMYHDQGLIPFKHIAFGGGVNYTAGLPVVRTSPDHGTAYDIAGKGTVDQSSFMTSIFTAIDIIRQRQRYHEMLENPLKSKGTQQSEAN